MLKMKNKRIQILRTAIQALFLLGLTTSVISGFMSLWSGVLAFVFFLTLLCGNFYCGWLCPFGTLQEWLGKAGSLLLKKKYVMPGRAQRYLQFSKYVVFIVIVMNSFLQIVPGFGTTSPFNGNYGFMGLASGANLAAAQGWTDFLVLAYLGAYAAASLVFERPFCNYFCPDSIRYNLLSMARVVSVKRDAGKCVNCGKCNRTCPMQIDVAAIKKLRHPSCINCMKCISNCPVEGALSYRL